MAHDLGYPEVGRPPLGPGHPANRDVVVGDDAPPFSTATADCRSDSGERWFDVEVPIRLQDG
jgi:hypothetical protein